MHELGKWLPAYSLDNNGQEKVSGIGIRPVGARPKVQRGLGKHADQIGCRYGRTSIGMNSSVLVVVAGVVFDTGRVGKKVPDFNPLPPVSALRQIFNYWVVERELSTVNEHHHAGCGELL